MTNRVMHCFFLLALCLLAASLNAQIHTSQWVKTYSWTGNGTMVTPIFKIFGENWRVVARMNRKAVLNVQVLNEKGDIYKNLTKGNPPMTSFTSWSMDGFASHFLFISSAGTPWEVTIEQYMDVSQEWEYKAALKKPAPKTPVTAWGGETDETFTFDVAGGPATMKLVQKTDGVVRVTILDENGKTIAANASQKASDVFETSIIKPGSYTLKIASSIPWNATLYRPAVTKR